ncbi:MAG: recombination-associated protein RdgC [Leptothrix sp. (in: Bacteria)]|nr:recombination-associated protein RdgC [Leptothrix sp. (in: b-proteobacteria)]
MFKNALVYRIEHWVAPPLAEIEQRLQGARFVECGASQPESVGWVEPRGEKHAALIESVGGQLILQLCTETKAVPGGVIKVQVQQRLDAIEKDTGRRPKGKLVKELKEEVIHALLPRAFPKRSDTLVWVDPKAQWLLVGAGSAKKGDAVVTRLIELLGGGLKLALVQTALSPATAMATWLAEQEAPAGFNIDRECELKQPDSEKATVRYARHTLDIAEVGEHIKQGKMPTQLALSWGERVSFVLSEALTLKKIKLLDVVLEGRSSATREDGGFDADVALVTGELQRLIPDLVAALGGLQERVAAAPLPSSPAHGTAEDEAAPWDSVPA